MSAPALEELLADRGVRIVGRLYEKDAGRSWVARVERAREPAVLKWVEETAAARCRDELAHERAFYRRFPGLRCAPNLLDELDAPGLGAGLVLTHHEGTTLRQWLLDRRSAPPDLDEIARCAEAVGSALRELFVLDVSEAPDREAERRRLGRVFTVLMKSGPIQAPVDEEERGANLRLYRWAAPLAHRTLTRALDALPERACIAHGDLHPNNVLITPEPRVLLLDFGRAEPGECVADLAYLATTLEIALADRPQAGELFAGEITRTLEALALPVRPFGKLVEVLRLGGSVNSRLRPDGKRPAAAARLVLLPRLVAAAARSALPA
ncbi:MAG: phosphotransferase [Myxococcota bacterium]